MRLEYVTLNDNSFSGHVHLPLCLNTYWMDMSNNQLIGKLQGNIGEILPNIFHLKLSNNSFTGSLPSSIGNMSLLGTFDVSLNNFSRQVPKELLADCLRLSSLVLSNNNFSGHFDWLSLFNLTELFLLKINHNQFSGAMSNELPNWVFLALLDVSNNMSELLLTLDVSDNRLSGSIPSAIANAASSLRILSLRGYCLGGTFPTQLSFSTQTGGSDNGQSEEYGEQDEVNIVTKYRNSSYTGNILNYMSGLDLSCNNLTGAIPLELGQLQEIHALNLSHNQLTGRTPNMKAQFGTFSASDYEGNPFLCGLPLEKSCTSTKDSPPTPTQSSYLWLLSQCLATLIVTNFISKLMNNGQRV
nr:receptor kinase-like protein Xa21 [Quercus suber]